MSVASADKIIETSNAVTDFIDQHGPEPYSNGSGQFLVCRAILARARMVGVYEAKFMRLIQGIGNNILAGAIYFNSEQGLDPDPITHVLQEVPVRIVKIKSDAPSTTIDFDGGILDLRDEPLTDAVANELIIDLAHALPYVGMSTNLGS